MRVTTEAQGPEKEMEMDVGHSQLYMVSVQEEVALHRREFLSMRTPGSGAGRQETLCSLQHTTSDVFGMGLGKSLSIPVSPLSLFCFEEEVKEETS